MDCLKRPQRRRQSNRKVEIMGNFNLAMKKWLVGFIFLGLLLGAGLADTLSCRAAAERIPAQKALLGMEAVISFVEAKGESAAELRALKDQIATAMAKMEAAAADGDETAYDDAKIAAKTYVQLFRQTSNAITVVAENRDEVAKAVNAVDAQKVVENARESRLKLCKDEALVLFDNHIAETKGILAKVKEKGFDTATAEVKIDKLATKKSELEAALTAGDKASVEAINGELKELVKTPMVEAENLIRTERMGSATGQAIEVLRQSRTKLEELNVTKDVTPELSRIQYLESLATSAQAAYLSGNFTEAESLLQKMKEMHENVVEAVQIKENDEALENRLSKAKTEYNNLEARVVAFDLTDEEKSVLKGLLQKVKQRTNDAQESLSLGDISTAAHKLNDIDAIKRELMFELRPAEGGSMKIEDLRKPEALEAMKQNPEAIGDYAKKNPEEFKKIMAERPALAQELVDNHPDQVFSLMKDQNIREVLSSSMGVAEANLETKLIEENPTLIKRVYEERPEEAKGILIAHPALMARAIIQSPDSPELVDQAGVKAAFAKAPEAVMPMLRANEKLAQESQIDMSKEDPNAVVKLLQTETPKANELFEQRPELAVRVAERFPEKFENFAQSHPEATKTMAGKEEKIKEFVENRPSISGQPLPSTPGVPTTVTTGSKTLEKLMRSDPEKARVMINENPELVTKISTTTISEFLEDHPETGATVKELLIAPSPSRACALITVFAKPLGGECKEFSSPCDVPIGWEKCLTETDMGPLTINAMPTAAGGAATSTVAVAASGAGGRLCIQMIAFAREPGGECKMFSTPCDVPEDWEKCKPEEKKERICPQVEIFARPPQSDKLMMSLEPCKKFSSPCDVPAGWTKCIETSTGGGGSGGATVTTTPAVVYYINEKNECIKVPVEKLRTGWKPEVNFRAISLEQARGLCKGEDNTTKFCPELAKPSPELEKACKEKGGRMAARKGTDGCPLPPQCLLLTTTNVGGGSAPTTAVMPTSGGGGGGLATSGSSNSGGG